MAFKMRLYHRRSSASRERLLLNNNLSSGDPLLKLRANVSHSPRGSIDLHGPSPLARQRSMSLYPGLERQNCLTLPPRSRSHSFSGIGSRPAEGTTALTSSQEDYIFKCYTRVMYFILGVTAATIVLFLLYGLHKWSQKNHF